MRIRVVDHYRWNRAKRIVRGWICFATFITAIGFIGGLEGETAHSYTLALVFFLISIAAFPNYGISSTHNKEGETR